MLVLFWATILFSVTGNNVIEANFTTTTPAKVCNCSTTPDLLETLWCFVMEKYQVIIAFFTGTFLTAIIYCLATKCCRKKQKSSEIMVETLDMVTTEAVPLTDAGQSAENDLKAAEGGAEAARQSVPDGQPEEVEYSDIDFSRWKRTSSTGGSEAEETQKKPESEYAELKKDERVEKQEDSGGEDSEMLEGNEEELGMMGEDEETKQATLGEEEGEAVGVSSDVNETMDEI